MVPAPTGVWKRFLTSWRCLCALGVLGFRHWLLILFMTTPGGSVRVRNSARLVLLDEQGRLLMFKYEDEVPLDPQRPVTQYWATLGGGLEGDETFEQAALRELWEETGIREAEIGPCLWTRERKFVFQGEDILSRERYFLVRVPGGEISLDNLFENERQTYRDHRWWSPGEMRASGEVFFPLSLADLLEPVLAGQLPTEPFQIDVRQAGT